MEVEGKNAHQVFSFLFMTILKMFHPLGGGGGVSGWGCPDALVLENFRQPDPQILSMRPMCSSTIWQLGADWPGLKPSRRFHTQ